MLVVRVSVLVMMTACLAQAANQTVRLEAVADTSIQADAPSRNFATADKLELAGNKKIALLRFDISGLPASAVVSAVRLHLFLEDSERKGSEPKFAVYDLGKEFTETQANYQQAAANQPWTAPGLHRYADYDVAPFSFRSRIFPVNGAAEVDLSPLLKIIIATRRKTVNLAVLCEGDGLAAGALLSHRFADPAKRPRLEITFNPTAPRAVSNHPLTDDKFGPVTLDAGESPKPDGSKTGLSYRWSVDTPSPGSSNSPGQELGREVKVKFDPDVPGRWTVRLRVTDTATKEFSEDTVAFTVAQMAPHPRLGLNESVLNQVKVHRTTKKPIWERYQSWLNAPQDPAYGSKGQALLYGYVVTKNHSYLDQAWKFYGDRLYVNGKDRSQGLRPFFGECGKAIYCKDREAANPGGFLVMEIALLYDWGFDGLNANQRVDVVEWLNNSSEYNYRQNAYVHAHFSDEGAAILLGLGAAAYATYGENRPASGQMVWFREEWAHTLRAMDAIGRGGATGPPNTYDEKAASALINLANLVYYASAENLFLAHPWFQRRLALEAFAADANAKPGASRPSGLALSRRFSGTEEADIWNSIFRQPGSDESPDAWTDLYYYSQAPALTKPSRLSLFDPGMGNVFIRSAWTAPDATAIHFWAGPHVSDRQALDQGSFTLSNRADPAAPGQIAKAPEPVDYEDYFARQDLYDVAKVANFGDNRQAVAWVADITNAYSKTQVAKAFRRCVYLREADVLIVADTLESLSPETPKIAQVRAIGKVAPELSKFDNADSFGASFNSSGKSYKVTFSKATSDAPLVEGMDLQAPVISNVKPGPVLPAGTGRTMLSLTTNEPAQCRFSYKPGTTYPYMSGNFTSANGLTHTVQSGTLDGGDTYTYYIRCQDKSGNENLEDLRLRFSVNIK